MAGVPHACATHAAAAAVDRRMPRLVRGCRPAREACLRPLRASRALACVHCRALLLAQQYCNAPAAEHLQHRCSPTKLLVIGQDVDNDIAQLASAIFPCAVAISGALLHWLSGLLALGCSRPGRTFQPSHPSTKALDQPRVLLLSFHFHRRARAGVSLEDSRRRTTTAPANGPWL